MMKREKGKFDNSSIQELPWGDGGLGGATAKFWNNP